MPPPPREPPSLPPPPLLPRIPPPESKLPEGPVRPPPGPRLPRNIGAISDANRKAVVLPEMRKRRSTDPSTTVTVRTEEAAPCSARSACDVCFCQRYAPVPAAAIKPTASQRDL